MRQNRLREHTRQPKTPSRSELSRRGRVLCLTLWLAGTVPAHAVCYVDGRATGGRDNGTSWTDAYVTLPSALANAACAEIWVAKGIYKPTSGSDPTISFDIRPGVPVYGGFAGGETSRFDKDPSANPTVLSGDIDANDALSGGAGIDATPDDIVGTNSHHVVTMDGTKGMLVDSDTVLDGFVITGGDAVSADRPWGGGLYCNGAGAGNGCSPVLLRLVFRGNRALWGGALFNDGSHGGSTFGGYNGLFFSGNRALAGGGAVLNDGESGGSSNPSFDNTTFAGNQAQNGGAVYNSGSGGTASPQFQNVTFVGNAAGADGGALFDDARIGDSGPLLLNVTIAGNSAGRAGGAIANVGSGVASGSALALHNAILWSDSAPFDAEIHNDTATAAADFSLIAGGCPSGTVCHAVLSSDPGLGRLGRYGGFTPTLRPVATSPAIDYGEDTGCPFSDQRGVLRPQGAHCDLGAVERKAVEDVLFQDGLERF